MEYKSQKHFNDVEAYFEATDHLPELPYIETMVTHGNNGNTWLYIKL